MYDTAVFSFPSISFAYYLSYFFLPHYYHHHKNLPCMPFLGSSARSSYYEKKVLATYTHVQKMLCVFVCFFPTTQICTNSRSYFCDFSDKSNYPRVVEIKSKNATKSNHARESVYFGTHTLEFQSFFFDLLFVHTVIELQKIIVNWVERILEEKSAFQL